MGPAVMTVRDGNRAVTDADEEGTDADRGGILGPLRRGIRWLRELHRGYAYTGHLPRRGR